jgi:hypothetical protein
MLKTLCLISYFPTDKGARLRMTVSKNPEHTLTIAGPGLEIEFSKRYERLSDALAAAFMVAADVEMGLAENGGESFAAQLELNGPPSLDPGARVTKYPQREEGI